MDGVVIFEPTDKHQLDEYPELADYEEFKSLTREELRFVWFFSNQTSPFYELDPQQTKISKCYDSAWGRLGRETDKIKYLSGNFPSSIISGMNRMRMFNPNKRARALAMTEKVFDDYEKIIETFKPKPGEDGKPVTLEKMKDYVDLTTKIVKELQNMVDQFEGKFGVKKKGEINSATFSIFDKAIKTMT